MLEQLGGSPQDEDETEALEGSPDPAMLIAATGGRFEHHPLFPRADRSAETRDIKFVSFCRRRASDQAIQNCPEDIPAREVKSWAQVVEWWGGGDYKAVGKDAKHRTVACSPSASGEWLTFDGDSKPFVLRKSDSTPGSTVAPPTENAAPAAPAPALAPQDALLDVMTQVLHELRTRRAPAAHPSPAADGLLVAMIQAQAAQATATIQAQAAQATATSQANAQMMQTLLSVVAQRRAEPATGPVDPTTMALQLISAMQKLVPTPAVAPGLAEQIAMIKALRDLYQPAPVAPTNELQPFVNIFGQVMAADATRTQAERAQTPTVPQEAPTPHPPPRPKPALLHVPGIGMVKVVAPDAGALCFSDMSTEELVAAIRKDPALLRELGIGVAPEQIAPVVPMVAVAPVAVAPSLAASPTSLASRPVVELVPAIPVVPDLEPTSILVVVATPPAAASTASSPSAVSVAPSDATVFAASPELSASATIVIAPEERRAIALPERMPDPEPLHRAAPDHQRVIGGLNWLTLLTHGSAGDISLAAPVKSSSRRECESKGLGGRGVRMAPQHRSARPRARASATSSECHRALSSAGSFSNTASRSARRLRQGRRGAPLPASLHAGAAEQRREESDVGDRDEAESNQPTRDGGARILGPRLREQPLGDPGQGFVQGRIDPDDHAVKAAPAHRGSVLWSASKASSPVRMHARTAIDRDGVVPSGVTSGASASSRAVVAAFTRAET